MKHRPGFPLAIFGLFTLLLLAACTRTEPAVLIEDPEADSVVFWPPTMNHARVGDTLYLRIHGLKRRAVCAVPLALGWNFRRDTTGNEHYSSRSRFEIPAGASCAADPAGLDTLFRVRFYTRAGKMLYLETSEGTITDSLLFVAGDAPGFVSVVTIRHPGGGPDSTVSGRFTFRDSTADHPRRMVRATSLATCQLLQTAVYERRADTTIVKVRLITAEQQSAPSLPACAGPHDDSVEAVFNRFNFLP